MYSNNELLIISNDIEYYGYDITHEIDMPVTRASTTKSKTFKSYETKTVKGNKKNGQLFFTASLHIIPALEI